jgi:hypothetical protein
MLLCLIPYFHLEKIYHKLINQGEDLGISNCIRGLCKIITTSKYIQIAKTNGIDNDATEEGCYI